MFSKHSEGVSPELPDISNQSSQDLAPFQNLTSLPVNNLFNPSVTNSTSTLSVEHPKESSASKFQQWTTEWITDWWGIELVCWVIAVLSLAAIVVLLEIFKDQPIPQWSYGITLNSFISIFTATGQMAMMKPVAECISQLKWLWFAQKKKISSFQAFDNASRGPFGSLALFWKLHGIHLVTLGAAITIVSVAFGPFVQQVVTYPLRLHPIGNATVPQVFNFSLSPANEGCSVNTISSVQEGLEPGNFSLSAVSPSCTTGNCTWAEYQSLGICSSVSDLSSTIIHNECNLTAFEEIFELRGYINPGYSCYNYTIPELVLSHNNVQKLQTTNAFLSNAFTDIDLVGIPMHIMSINPSYNNVSSGPIFTSYLMYQPGFLASVNSTLPSPIAYGLDLDFCIQTYNTTMANGVTNTTLISSRILNTQIQKIFEPSTQSIDYFSNNTYISIRETMFRVSSSGIEMLVSMLSNTLTNDCFNIFTILGSSTFFCNSEVGVLFWHKLVDSTNLLSDVTEQWENMAISMTNTFRNGAGGDTTTGNFQGTAFAPIAFVEANYLWLILPISLVFLTLVFLLATISKSQRLGSRVWKSSNLATLQGLDSELHTKLGGLSSIHEMEENAKDIEARFNLNVRTHRTGQNVEYRIVESKQEAYWK